MSGVLYKTMDGTAGAYGHGCWDLPKGDRPGKWMPKTKPVLCDSGYHYCRDLKDVLAHVGPELYEVEVRGVTIDGDDKAVAEQARLVRRIPEWNDETCRLFAVDCARLSLQCAAEEQKPLLSACLDVTTAYALYGNEWAAARDAARAAARAAAWAAAGDAAWDAARDAAWAAAWAAARAAARAAAWAAARDAQIDLLTRYLAGEQGPLVDGGAS